jgi:alpha-beta hydrolase superfamily lysophospholipase
MRIPSLVKKTGKTLMFASFGAAAAFVSATLVTGWIMVRPGKRRDDGIIHPIRFGPWHPLALEASDGLRLHAWAHLSRKAHPNDWVLLLHGVRSDLTAVQNRSRFFSRRGYNVVLLHFRGHGSSDHSRISYGYHERKDVQAAFEFIRSLRPAAKMRVGIDGISMGAAAAAYAIGDGLINPDWMILESCYDNIHNALKNRLALRFDSSLIPFISWPLELVVEYLMRLRAEDLDPAKAIEKARCPVLLLAGDSEQVLKTVEVEYLYGCIPKPKRLMLFPGASHEDLLAFDPRRFAKAVGGFLRDFAPRSPVSA